MISVWVGEFADFFTQLFTGTGSWLGVLILIAFFVVLRAVNKWTVIISFAISILIGFTYLDADLGWQCFVMWISTVVIMLSAAKDVG